METVFMIFLFVVVAIGTGLFSDLVSFATGDPNTGEIAKGRIGAWLGAWALNGYNKAEHDERVEADKRAAEFYKNGNDGTTFPRPYFPVNWWKLLVCPTCYNVWISLFAFVVLMHANDLSGWYWMAVAPFLGASNVSLSMSRLARFS